MTSTQPRKQRRSMARAPWHVRHHLVAAHVDPVLRKKSDWTIPRAVPVRKGDEVLIARGGFRGRKGKVIGVDVSKGTVTIEGIKIKKMDDKEVPRRIHPSNLIIVAFDETDPRRRERLREEREE